MNRIRPCLALFLTVTLLAEIPAAESVRVETANGVPQIRVDGQPVRARIFFGIPGSRPLQAGPEGRQVSFEFAPTETELQRGTMHFRFGQVAGELLLDDIQVTDLTEPSTTVLECDFQEPDSFTREWHVWPPPNENSVGEVTLAAGAGADNSQCLRIRLVAPPRGNWPDFHIYHRPDLALRREHRYRVSFWVRATPEREVTVAFYRPGQQYTLLGGPPGCYESQIRLAADADVNFVSFPVHMPWPRPGRQVDWSTADRQCQAVLDANPDALLIPRIGLGAPRWWQDAHPESVMVWDQGPQQHTNVVVASPVYLRDAAARLEALIRHLEQRFGAHMAGYHPCGQNTGEWFYQETWGTALNGYSGQSLAAWRRWLQVRYETDERLQRAWGDPSAVIRNVAIPAPELRRSSPTGLLHDPTQMRSLIDFAEFQQQMMANCVCHFASVVRRACQGRRLVVFFYGYVHEFGAIRNGPATSGHYALRQVLDCPDIDVLCSPISYFDRGLGGSGPAMTAAESVMLAGKLWLVEDDTRTYLGTGAFPGWKDGARTIEDTNRLLLRNTAQCAVRNFATWWMDLGATGWFNDPRMWQQMKRLRALDQPLLISPRPFQPEIAVVVDERSMLRVAAGGDAVTRPAVYEVRRPVARAGAPWGQYLLDDVLAGKVKARLYIFTNCWCLSADQRRELLQVTAGAAKIWCYAPGYHEPAGPALNAMRELTGFQLARAQEKTGRALPTERGRRLLVTQPVGTERSVTPLFAAVDARDEETLARYASGERAVAARELDSGWSVFVGPPGLTAPLVRFAAKRAGVHLYTDKDCNVYANGRYLVLHACQVGEIEIDTGYAGTVRDLLDDRPLGTGPRIKLDLQRGDTRVLEIGR